MPFLSAVNSALAAEHELSFAVVRDGSEIGTHRISIHTEGDETRVEIETEVAVKIAFVTVYNFDHEGHEVWQGGRLVSYDSETDDDGTDKTLHARLTGGRLVVDGSASRHEADAGIVPASLWNPLTVEQRRLLNTLDGSEMAIDVRFAGTETVEAEGAPVTARHYQISGELTREVWYGEDGTLVKVRFPGSDGSDIQYILR